MCNHRGFFSPAPPHPLHTHTHPVILLCIHAKQYIWQRRTIKHVSLLINFIISLIYVDYSLIYVDWQNNCVKLLMRLRSGFQHILNIFAQMINSITGKLHIDLVISKEILQFEKLRNSSTPSVCLSTMYMYKEVEE